MYQGTDCYNINKLVKEKYSYIAKKQAGLGTQVSDGQIKAVLRRRSWHLGVRRAKKGGDDQEADPTRELLIGRLLVQLTRCCGTCWKGGAEKKVLAPGRPVRTKNVHMHRVNYAQEVGIEDFFNISNIDLISATSTFSLEQKVQHCPVQLFL